MAEPSPLPQIEDLLAHSDWLRALARRLVEHDDVACDVEQETWLVALENPPRNATAPRQWLAQVLRNVVRQRRRSESARREREARVARPEAISGSEETLERFEALRVLIESVHELDEPYRSTLLLRHQDGLSVEEIAMRQAAPASTVRNRIQRGLAQLRERLEKRHGDAWSALLIPLLRFDPSPTAVASAPGAALAAGSTALLSMATLKPILAAAAVLIVGAGLWWKLTEPAIENLGATSPQAAERVSALAESPPATPAERTLAAASSPDEVSQISKPVSARGSVIATVTWEADGSPASDVVVHLHPWGESSSFAFESSRSTDAQGRVRFDGVASGLAAIGSDRADGEMLQVQGSVETEVALVIPRGVLVRGQVVDHAGAAVAFARVWLSQYGNHSTGDEVARADAVGHFTLRDVGEARFIAARAAGFSPSVSTPVPGDPGDSVDVRIELPPNGGELRGSVRAPDGSPVAGAAIQVGYEGITMRPTKSGAEAYSPPPLRMISDEHGEFVATGVASPRSRVECRARDFAPFAREIDFVAESVVTLAIELQPGAALEGVVLGADGKPADKVSIGIGHYGYFASSNTRTAPDGSFRIDGLAPGETAIRVGGGAEGEADSTLSLIAGETARLDLQLKKHGIVAGRVIDESGTPLAGWRVESVPADAKGQNIRRAITGSEGKFNLDNWPQQANALELYQVGHFNAPPALTVPAVEVGRTDLELVIPADCMASATLVGRLLGPTGEVVSEAHFLWGERGANRKYLAEMNSATGEFRAQMQPGFYELEARSPSMGTLGLPQCRLRAGETLDLGALRFAAPGRVRVKLQRPASSAAAFDVRSVNARVLGPGRLLMGQLAFDDKLEGLSAPLAAGEYTVEVSSGIFHAPRRRVEVRAGEDLLVEIALEPSTLRSFRMTWDPAVPVKGLVEFVVSHADGKPFDSGAIPATDDGGSSSFAVLGLTVGTYWIDVKTSDGRAGRASFTIDDLERSKSELELRLQ